MYVLRSGFSRTLKELEEEGLVERRTYVDSALIEYALTERGEAMRPLMDEIHRWADQTYATTV